MQHSPITSSSPTDYNEPPLQGLSEEEALRRLAEWGPNDLQSVVVPNAASEVLRLFLNPLVITLLVAAFVSAWVGQVVGATIVVSIVLLGIVLNAVQTHRSQAAVDALRSRVAPTATVVRNGVVRELPCRELVPGDVVRLSAGDLVPADAVLVQAKDLHVQQGALTGESMPVEKESFAGDPSTSAPIHDHHLVFLGTSVVSGTATAVVHVTGKATTYGAIAARLAARSPETEFDRGTRRFSLLILETVVCLVFCMLLFNLALHRDVMQSLLFAVALAVGLTPEFLPMIITVTLAHGAVRMGRRHVIVKHLSAIQNFGSMDILCSDKTGTLTAGEMRLERVLDPFGRPAPEVFAPAFLNSSLETGIKSPLDAAILAYAQVDISPYHKLDEVPFDFERRRLSVVVEKEGARTLITKGAPEGVLAATTALIVDGAVRSFDAAASAACCEVFRSLGTQGFRVLAVAQREVGPQAAYRAEDERDLVLYGFLAFIDPPLPDTARRLRALHRDGVEVKLLTGDNELVTRHVCERIGLDATEIVIGDDLDRMTDAALAHVAEQTTVFARVSPSQKNRIILALKRRSHVVGYIGDGINDAPSLHSADVGISVASAVDVAKDAADIILLERDLKVLHAGIIEGRMAFGNVMKYLLMGTSSNFGNMFSMAIASLFLPFLPMLPVQVLLNNFLYDLAQVTIPTDNVDRSFVHKPRRWNISLIRSFMICVGPISSLFDFLTFYVLLKYFEGSEMLFHTGWFVESLFTQTLVLFVIRTAGNPFRSRPSNPLVWTVLSVVGFGLALPFSPAAGYLGFAPLPAAYFIFIVVATAAYLFLVDIVKRRLMNRPLPSDSLK